MTPRAIAIRFLLLLPAALWLAVGSFAQDLASRADQYMQAQARVNHFSGSVLIGRRGQVLFSKGYGMANWEDETPNTPQTKFRLGSLTKQFTSMATLMLQERGKLAVEDAVCKYVPDCPKAWEEVTLHHLLTHTSGIPNFTTFPDYRETITLPSPPEKTIARFKNKPLEFKPGEKFAYSNSGYILLGFIIEKVSGKPYEDFLRESIFEPLHMTGTGYDHQGRLLKHRAVGYLGVGETLRNAPYLDLSVLHSAGALYSTVEDLYRWDQALGSEKLVSKKSLAALFTPFRANYAYGWTIGTQFQRKTISHGGTVNGFSGHLLRYPDDNVCVIVLSNLESAPASQIGRDLSAMALGENYELPRERRVGQLDPKLYEAYAGRYELAPNFILTITREGDHFLGQAPGQPQVELYPESESDFFVQGIDARLTFIKDEKGRVTQAIVHYGGRDLPARKME